MLAQKLVNILNTYGEGFVGRLKDKLDTIIKPPATGRGAASIDYDIEGTSLNISGLAYLTALDSGSSGYRNFPSPRNIETWVRAKGITSTEGLTIKQLSFAISRSIADRGTRPTDFIDVVFREDRDRLTELLAEAITETIDITTTKPAQEQAAKTNR
jgi:hypothetical protein